MNQASFDYASEKLVVRLPDGRTSGGVENYDIGVSSGFGPMGDLLYGILLDRLYLANNSPGDDGLELFLVINDRLFSRLGLNTDLQVAAFQEAMSMMVSSGLIVEELTPVGGRFVRLEVDVTDRAMSVNGSSRKKDSPGCVYLIHAIGTDRYKIGKTTQVNAREPRLRKQSPFPISIVALISTENPYGLEDRLHSLYDAYRVHGEWFELPADAIAEICAMGEVA